MLNMYSVGAVNKKYIFDLCISQFHLRPTPAPTTGLTPGHKHFFCLGWQIPMAGDS